jgi:hypothetical protein
MPIVVYDYASKTASPHAQPLSKQSEPVREFIDAFIAEEHWVTDYFNHNDNRDPGTNGGPLFTGVKVNIYYAPCTTREYNNWDVIGLKNNTIWASGKRRIAVRIDNGVHKFYLATHTGKSIAGVRDSSTYNYLEINLVK